MTRTIFIVTGFALLLSACVTTKSQSTREDEAKFLDVTTAAEIQPGEVLVLAAVHQIEFKQEFSFIGKKGSWADTRARRISFYRYDPPPQLYGVKGERPRHARNRAFIRLQGEKGQIKAYRAKPGKYIFTGGRFDAVRPKMFEENAKFNFELKTGEAVYIGDVAARLTPSERATISGIHFTTKFGSVDFEVADNRARARRYFKNNFAGSGLTYTDRLATYRTFAVPRVPIIEGPPPPLPETDAKMPKPAS